MSHLDTIQGTSWCAMVKKEMSFVIHSDRWCNIGEPLQISNKKVGTQCKHWTSLRAKKFEVGQPCEIHALGHNNQCEYSHWYTDSCVRLFETWTSVMRCDPSAWQCNCTQHMSNMRVVSHFSGNLWTIHPTSPWLCPIWLSFVWATEAALGMLLIPQ